MSPARPFAYGWPLMRDPALMLGEGTLGKLKVVPDTYIGAKRLIWRRGHSDSSA